MTNRKLINILFRSLVNWGGEFNEVTFNVDGRDIHGVEASDGQWLICDKATGSPIIMLKDDDTDVVVESERLWLDKETD